MNEIVNSLIFYPCAVLLILFAILAIKFKNIFYSLLSAILVFFLAGMIFYLLGSEYNAVIQIAIYGVAIPVILGLAIMFTNLKKEKNFDSKKPYLKGLVILISGIFILSIIYLTITSFLINPQGFNVNSFSDINSIQVMNAFSTGIFVKYIWAFELISLILTIIVVGFTLFNNKEAK